MSEGEREGKKGIMQKLSGNCYPIFFSNKNHERICNDLIHCEPIEGIFCFAEVHKRKIRYPWQMSTMNIST